MIIKIFSLIERYNDFLTCCLWFVWFVRGFCIYQTSRQQMKRHKCEATIDILIQISHSSLIRLLAWLLYISTFVVRYNVQSIVVFLCVCVFVLALAWKQVIGKVWQASIIEMALAAQVHVLCMFVEHKSCYA